MNPPTNTICFSKSLAIQKSHQRCSVKKGLQTLLKKSLCHRCFPVNFAKFLRTPFLQKTSERLLLAILKISSVENVSFEKRLHTMSLFLRLPHVFSIFHLILSFFLFYLILPLLAKSYILIVSGSKNCFFTNFSVIFVNSIAQLSLLIVC